MDLLGGVTSQGGKNDGYGSRAVNLPNEALGISGLDQGTSSIITSRTSE